MKFGQETNIEAAWYLNRDVRMNFRWFWIRDFQVAGRQKLWSAWELHHDPTSAVIIDTPKGMIKASPTRQPNVPVN
ncbi:MAG: hypothetical protein ACI9XZ_004345 [Alphaproteobacteria bacterium]|jgi:hypothetical protein